MIPGDTIKVLLTVCVGIERLNTGNNMYVPIEYWIIFEKKVTHVDIIHRMTPRKPEEILTKAQRHGAYPSCSTCATRMKLLW